MNNIELFEKSKPIAESICSYFDGVIIGSALLLLEMDSSLINDIDVTISNDKYKNVSKFLLDSGFKETESPHKTRYEGFKKGSMIFEKKGFLPIHLLLTKDPNFIVKENKEIWAEKIKRLSESDINQITSMMENVRYRNMFNDKKKNARERKL